MALAWCFLCSLATCLTDLIQTFLVPLLLQTLILTSKSDSTAYTTIGAAGETTPSSPLQLSSSSSFLESSAHLADKIQFNSTTIKDQQQHASHLFEFLANFLNITSQLLTRLVIYLTINLVCLYTKYLIDLAQRNAFLETRRSIETRAKIERENDKQERLLLSLLPRFVALEIIADIAKEDNHDKLLKNQFHKIYIHSYANVR